MTSGSVGALFDWVTATLTSPRLQLSLFSIICVAVDLFVGDCIVWQAKRKSPMLPYLMISGVHTWVYCRRLHVTQLTSFENDLHYLAMVRFHFALVKFSQAGPTFSFREVCALIWLSVLTSHSKYEAVKIGILKHSIKLSTFVAVESV